MNALNQWQEQRSGFSDWIGQNETRDRKLVQLDSLPHSSALAAHPGLFATLRWCVGLQRLGGILYPIQPASVSLFYDPGDPVSVEGQWLLHRGVLSDWVAEHETAKGQFASLANQSEGLVAHPLPFGMLRSVVGLQRLGGASTNLDVSRFVAGSAEDDPLSDIGAFESEPQPEWVQLKCVGFQPLGGIMFSPVSYFASGSAEVDLLLDAISDEDLRILIDEDTGEPLGIG